MARMSRIAFTRISIGLAAAFAAAIAFAAPAAAHSTVVSSTPAEGEVLTSSPATFSVTANEDLADVTGTGEGFALRIVFVPTGDAVATGALTIDGPTLSTPGVPLEPGPYLMEYQIVSADGHPVSGRISFTVAGEDSQPTAEPSAAPQPEPEPEVTTNVEPEILPIGAQPDAPAVPGWLGGAIASLLLAAGAIAAASSRRR